MNHTFRKNQFGFGAVVFLLAVVLVAVLGGVGYYVYASHKSTVSSSKTSTSSPVANTNNTATTASSNEMPITEWGVKMTKPASLASVHYDFVHDMDTSTIEGVRFKSNLESQLTGECKDRVKFGIDRLTKAELATFAYDPIPESTTKHIGNYYYVYHYVPTLCSESEKALETKMNDAYKSMYDSLTAS